MSRSVNRIIEKLKTELPKEYTRGDIYYINRGGYNVGSEQAAGRPAVIVSNDLCNKHSPDVTVVYLTTQPKTELPTHVFINSSEKVSIALCETVATISKERIGNFYGTVTKQEAEQIDKALMITLALNKNVQQEPQRAAERHEKAEKAEFTEERLKEAERAYKQTLEGLEESRKETAFYKMLYEDLLEKTKRFAVGGGTAKA
jgi:mRNA interferase MazF